MPVGVLPRLFDCVGIVLSDIIVSRSYVTRLIENVGAVIPGHAVEPQPQCGAILGDRHMLLEGPHRLSTVR